MFNFTVKVKTFAGIIIVILNHAHVHGNFRFATKQNMQHLNTGNGSSYVYTSTGFNF